MSRTFILAASSILAFALVHSTTCAPLMADDPQAARELQSDPSSEPVVEAQLTVQLKLDREVYGKTRYKNPPQFAVWIEDPGTGAVRTLYVTQKMGRGTWNGKPTVPVSLPYWASRPKKQSGIQGDPTTEKPLADAITQPTPTDLMNVTTSTAVDSTAHCYVEVNVSGDFNDAFPPSTSNGTKDTYGNGQPSLIYRATINANADNRARFQLLGRTGQWKPSSKINKDLKGITTAKDLFSRMRVTVDTP